MEIDTQHFKELLLAEKANLEKELATVGRKNPDRKGDWEAENKETGTDRADEDEVADNLADLETNNAIVNQLEPKLNEVLAALTKMEIGTFGLCEICDNPIETDRLEANPSAKTCKAHM